VKLGDVAADIALVAERKPSVVVVAQGRPAVLRAIDAHVKPAAVADEASSEAEPTTAEENTTTKESTQPTSAPQGTPAPQEDAARFESAADEHAPAPAVPTDPKIAKRLHEWRERMRTASRTVWQRPGDAATPAPTWRDELVAWGRSIANGLHRDAPPRPSALLKSAQARLNIPDELMPAIALGYAVHLNGTTASPADLATLLRHRWDEALGRGVLGALGVLRWRNSRISLAAAVAAYLDERGPVSGVLVGVPGEKLPAMERCAVVAPELPLDIVAGRCTALADAVLVPRPYVNATTIQLESKLRVAVPIVEVTRDLTDLASVFVRVASAEEADALGLRVIAEIGND
jgi:hypothetical protein